MTLALFLGDPHEVATAVPGATVSLTGAEAHHAAVHRLRVGEALIVADGRGRQLTARAVAVSGTQLVAEVVQVRDEQAPQPEVVVVQALAKGDRGELAVELMTEVGVDLVVPWQAARAVVRWDPQRAHRGLLRWRSTAVAAAKQSRRTWFPQVADLATTSQVLDLIGAADAALVLHESAADPIGTLTLPRVGRLVLVVGPEGGITDEEIAQMQGAGARVVLLGPTVMRTSTAGAVGAVLVLAAVGRLARPAVLPSS